MKDKAKTAATRFGWKQPLRELSGRAKSIEAFEPIHPMPQAIGWPDSVDVELNGPQYARALYDELEIPVRIPQQDMLPTVSHYQDHYPTWQCSEIKR